MNLISLETKLMMLKRLSLCADLLKLFSDLKKQVKYAYKLTCSYCKHVSKNEYFLGDSDKNDVELLANDIKEIAVRFRKASKKKNIKVFNRAMELLSRFKTEIKKSISELESVIETEKCEYNYIGTGEEA